MDIKVIVVIPTYNERENIRDLIEQILNLELDLEVLIIDDNSPDGTGKIVDELARHHQEVSVIHRAKKLGIGSAYICGFKAALDKGYDYILTMDADLSHQPRFLSEFIKKIQEYDLVIGSRYIDGGTIINWSIQRKLLSKYSNLIVRNLLGLRFNDCTSGFRCYRRTVLSSLNLDKIISDGYAFQIEMLYLCGKLGYKIGQIPIVFIDRKDGKSKISKKEIGKAVKLIFKLRWNHQLA